MKKYIKPAIEAVEIAIEGNILTASTPRTFILGDALDEDEEIDD